MRALLDLLFPVRCAGCGRADAVVCRECATALAGPPRVRRPSPCPPSLPTPYAVSDYAGVTRALVLGYKERDLVALTRPLAAALAASLTAALAAAPGALVVPVPSTRVARRRRGFDPVLRLTRAAHARLGEPIARPPILPVLAHVRDVRDSAGLSASQRAANLRGAFGLTTAAASAVRGRTVIVVDDLVTTGATLAEAARALRDAGAVVLTAAVIAATCRREELARPGLPNRQPRHYGEMTRAGANKEATAWTSS